MIVNRKYYFVWILPILLALTSCEDVIDINLDEGTPQLAVDAFITNEMKTQTISLSITSPYFENSASPRATGATVKLIDGFTAQEYLFTDVTNNGLYNWTPSISEQLTVGNIYTLSITYDGEQYQAQSILNPTPPIDSISVLYRDAEPPNYPETGYYASLYAFDIAGRPDFYWIKTYLNGQFNNSPGSILISQDGAFEGDASDGLLFIPPIRESITPFGTVYNEGDSLKVEIMSLNFNTYAFLGIAQSQLSNAGLFAEPPVNVPTNIFNVDTTSEVLAIGWFNMGAVSADGITIQP